MALTLENFQNSIQNKFFVSIESIADILTFTGSSGQQYQNIATNANVIVFLPQINKIFARGTFYGIENPDEVESKLGTIDTTITTLGESLSSLTGLVQTHSNIIGTNLDSEQQAIITNANGIIGEIATIKAAIEDIGTGGNVDLTPLIEAAVTDALNNQLESTQTITTITNQISTISTTLANKAEKNEFDTLARKIGNWQWFTEAEIEEDPSLTNYTISQRVTELLSKVDQIPHFAIEVVDQLPTTNISQTTIYLVRSQHSSDAQNNEIFTEYIYIDRNKNQKDENEQPLPESWGWESLGRQYFNVSNYLELSNDAWNEIRSNIESAISNIQTRLGDADIQQIAINSSNITLLQTQLQSLENNISQYITSQNGDLIVTGSHIKTSDSQASEYIANDIASLKNNKMDKTALEWLIIE